MKAPKPFLETAPAAILTLLGLLGLLAADRAGAAPGPLQKALELMRSRDPAGELDLTTGYYEDLLNMNERVVAGKALFDRPWFPKGLLGAPTRRMDYIRVRRDFLKYEFAPSVDVPDVSGVHTVTNRFGMADREHTLAKPPHTRRIALLGDSVLRGFGVPLGESFEALLERRLNETRGGEAFEFLNFGVDGYGLTQDVDVAIEKAAPFRPDSYVVSLTGLAVYDNWCLHLDHLLSDGIDLKYDFLRDLVRRAGVRRTDDPKTRRQKLAPFRIETLRWALSSIRSQCAKSGAPLFVWLVPTAERPAVLARDFQGIADMAAGMGIPVLNLLDTFEGVPNLVNLRISPGDRHPNRAGHEMIFENLWRKLRARPDAWAALTGEPQT